jgi:hypothetical protein
LFCEYCHATLLFVISTDQIKVAIAVEAFTFMTTWMVTAYRYVKPLIFGSKVFWFAASNVGRIATVPLVCTSSAEGS